MSHKVHLAYLGNSISQDSFYFTNPDFLKSISKSILDCHLYFGGAHTIQDFFEFLLFGKLYAKTHFTTVIHGVLKLQKVTKISFPV